MAWSDKYILKQILKDDCKTQIFTEHYDKEVCAPILLEDEFLGIETEDGLIVMGDVLRIFYYDNGLTEVTCTDGLVLLQNIKLN